MPPFHDVLSEREVDDLVAWIVAVSDFEDVPEAARDLVKFVWMSNVDDAIGTALEPASGAAEHDPNDLSDDQRRLASG